MSKKQVSIVIPSSPNDIKAIKDGIKEISNSMTRVDAEKEHQKETIETLSEKYGIDKKYIRRMASDFHKNQFEDKDEEHSEYSKLYESVID